MAPKWLLVRMFHKHFATVKAHLSKYFDCIIPLEKMEWDFWDKIMHFIRMHIPRKSAFFPRLFQASATPRPQNSDLDEKDTLFSLDA
jgi:hypothetical protein